MSRVRQITRRFKSLLAPDRKAVSELEIKKGAVYFPKKGKLYVATDFHTDYDSFLKFLLKSEVIKKIRNDEDAYCLILGDSLDYRIKGDVLGDKKILEHVMNYEDQVQKRFIHLIGNHENDSKNLFQKYDGCIPEEIKNSIIENLYINPKKYLDQFTSLLWLEQKHVDYINTMPTVAFTDNRIALVHAAPSNIEKDLNFNDEDIIQESTWARPEETNFDYKYNLRDQENFLKKTDSDIMISGHNSIITLFHALGRESIKKMLGVYGNQLFFSSSDGALLGKKYYLEIDLEKKYNIENIFECIKPI